MLELADVHVRYGGVTAVRSMSCTVDEGEIVSIIGPNGAGKTTTLRAITGLVPPVAGRVVFDGRDISRWKPHRIVRLGLSHAPEGRRLFPYMTVLENLMMGAYRFSGGPETRSTLEAVFGRFPRLAERRGQRAGTLSGGEQQMLAIGRALMARPRLLVLDEPSLGLAPMIVREIASIIRGINRDQGVGVLLVEQNARMALGVSARAYVMETGRIVLSGTSVDLRESPHVKAAYLGG